MSEKAGPYHVVDLTPWRRVVLNMLDLAGSKHSMCGLLEVTVMFDHDVIDGAPAARFTPRLVELIESVDGPDEEQDVH